MNKEQLQNMRAIIASEVRGSAFPNISQSVLKSYERAGWLYLLSGVYRSTESGRHAVLVAGEKR